MQNRENISFYLEFDCLFLLYFSAIYLFMTGDRFEPESGEV